MDIVLKRVMAYIIDILLVLIVMSPIINWKVINPYIDEYSENYNEYVELVEQANNGEIDPNDEEYQDKIVELNYNVNKYKVISSSISIGSNLLYFVILQWALKGQTLGKKIMKIRVVAKNENKKLNIGNYLLRSIILNNVIFSIILIVFVYLMSARSYYTLCLIISYLQLLVMAIIMLMVVLRKDYRGLHDVIAGTKVIDLSVAPVSEEPEEVVVIEAKETKDTKSTTKKKTKRTKK